MDPWKGVINEEVSLGPLSALLPGQPFLLWTSFPLYLQISQGWSRVCKHQLPPSTLQGPCGDKAVWMLSGGLRAKNLNDMMK